MEIDMQELNTPDFIANLVCDYNTIGAANRKIMLAEICRQNRLQELYDFTKGEQARVALRILADLGDRITDFVKANIDGILLILRGEDPKSRMLAAQIIGNTCASDYLDDLLNGIMHEETMFALPSYLLAIGSAKNDRAKRFLEAYTIRSDQDKHIMEEKAALNKALANFVARTKTHVRILPSDIVFLSAPNPNVTYSACTNANLSPRKFGKYIAVSNLKDFYDIYQLRAFSDAYIYLGKSPVKDLPEFLAKREDAILQRTGVTGYRLEIRSVSHEVRIDIIKKCVASLKTLINTPSAYSIELLIEIDADEAIVLLNPLTDNRFEYRKRSIAASISPGVAASICAYASEYFTPDARVLDNFCGSGTMLYERGIYPHHTLTGVDINSSAIEAATQNSRYAHVHPQFHHMDALKFTAKKYDEIISNMPFGLRVGSHSQNERLYKNYFRILPDILTDKGLVVLFTHEKQLVQDLAIADFDILKRATFDAGGLYPAVFILRKK
ncbi:MAG: methyltransferase [Christensenellaceae bacterium]